MGKSVSSTVILCLLSLVASLVTALSTGQCETAPANNRSENSISLNAEVLVPSSSVDRTNAALVLAQRILKQSANVEVKIRKIRAVSSQELHGLFNGKTIRSEKIRSNEDFILIVLPRDEKITDTVLGSDEGRAQGIGLIRFHKQPYAIIRAQPEATTEGKIIAHEIGHLLGATHTKDGIMQPHVTDVSLAQGFVSQSLVQIRASLSRNNQPFSSHTPETATAVTGSKK